MSADTQINAMASLLRFLTQDARLPLSTAMSCISILQRASLASLSDISSTPLPKLQSILTNLDEKQLRALHNASKRVVKRSSSNNSRSTSQSVEQNSPSRKRKRVTPTPDNAPSAAAEEARLALPNPVRDESKLRETVLFTNRAPLVLAFTVVLLKYTMPKQPLSSRLSLAQAVVSIGAKKKAISLGLERGKDPEDEGYGQGQPAVKIMGRDIRVMRRAAYDVDDAEDGADGGEVAPRAKTAKLDDGEEEEAGPPTQSTLQDERGDTEIKNEAVEADGAVEAEPALWGLDLDALKKSNKPPVLSSSSRSTGTEHQLPIYPPPPARSYILRAFASADPLPESNKKAKDVMIEKEQNLGLLLGALELLYESWSGTLSTEELDRRAWSWYVAVRPDVLHGPAGWGNKGEVRLSRILDLRKSSQ